MADSEQNSDAITPDIFINVIQGKGTQREREIVMKAIDDPHSELHDWLEAMENWALQNFGGQNYSSKASDRIIGEAVARQHREDVVAFLQRKRSEGKLTDEQLSRLLSEGAIEPSAAFPLKSEEYRESADRMLKLAAILQPTLTAEIAEINTTRGPNKT